LYNSTLKGKIIDSYYGILLASLEAGRWVEKSSKISLLFFYAFYLIKPQTMETRNPKSFFGD